MFSTFEDTAQLRDQLINESVIPAVSKCFEAFPQLKSAVLLVGQYDCGEVINAVHQAYFFSVLEIPDIKAAFEALLHFSGSDPVNLPHLPPHHEIIDIWLELTASSQADTWDPNSNAIDAFAPYCPEGTDISFSFSEIFNPLLVLYKRDQNIEVELIGQVLRPSFQSNGWADHLICA